jgi:Asp-tRNA(Asn)/Glu-tRNA(Gln) amidotransferase A subunit family amidase
MQPCDLSASDARFLIGTRKLSPVELTESCLARVEAVNRHVNGVVAIDAERARREAAAAEQAVMRGDPLPALHGLPVAIKDLVDTAGLRTTYGSKVYEQHVPERDESLVAALRRHGGIVCMKTNTPEWGAGGNTFNPVYGVSGNPFNPALTCGGSSGGSAIALATGMVPLALGSDNAGSLRIPAALCGVVGMRATAGLVPSEKRAVALSHLHVDGPMARTAQDTLLMLSCLATRDTRDALAGVPDPELASSAAPEDLASLRVAYSADLGGFAPADPVVREAFGDRVARLRSLFRAIGEASPDFTGADRVYEVLRAVAYVGTWGPRYREAPGKWGRLVRENLEQASRYTIDDIGAAHADYTRIYQRTQGFFANHDLLVLPTVAVSAWPKHAIYPAAVDGSSVRSYFDWVRITYAITLVNHPCISIPCGLDRHGIPFGLQLVAPRGRDAFLLRVAMALERVLKRDPATRRPVPDLDWLARQPVEDPLAKAVS